MRELAGDFNVRELVFDPWRFGQAAQELEREGIAVTQFPQTDVRMIPASDRLYRAIVEKRLTIPDNEELRQHAASAIARHGRRGWRIDKAQRSDNVERDRRARNGARVRRGQAQTGELLGWL